MPNPPPPYELVAVNDLVGRLSQLSVAGSSPTRLESSRPTTPPREAPPGPVTPPRPRNNRIFEFHSPTHCGRTSEWSIASHLTQGVPEAHVHSVVQTPKKKRRKKAAHVVFYGRCPGTYTSWYGPDGAEAQVKHVSAAVHQGYESIPDAERAFEYASSMHWTGVRGSASPSQSVAPTQAIPVLPLPLHSLNNPGFNPLHGSTRGPVQTWYIVYAGITPGIYLSFLECALNTVGLSTSAHDSVTLLAEAWERWDAAVAARSIRVLTYPYSPN
ncbi:hypothetical protein C8R43DRAFT_1141251 [Mycena crocata]|nr:hypothetical protein C8R43DRAFT_1141251 [Mycena crocata]